MHRNKGIMKSCISHLRVNYIWIKQDIFKVAFVEGHSMHFIDVTYYLTIIDDKLSPETMIHNMTVINVWHVTSDLNVNIFHYI